MPIIVALQELIASAARAPGTYYSSGFKVAACRALSFFEDITARGGTTTLKTTMETSPDNQAGHWSEVNDFTQKSAVGFDSEHMAQETFGAFIRVKAVVGGAGSITFGLKLEKKESYE